MEQWQHLTQGQREVVFLMITELLDRFSSQRARATHFGFSEADKQVQSDSLAWEAALSVLLTAAKEVDP